MTAERWKRLGELFHAALALDVASRDALLAEACAGDAPLRREVESLLAAHEDAASFLEEGPAASPGEAALAPGRRLGRYQVESLLAAGGMGEVYRARDAVLGRDVALKVLRRGEALRGRTARLVREARAASAVEHPNVLVVHDVGNEGDLFYVVSELLDGETLRARLGAGSPLPLAQCLDCARQMVDALAAAHEKGIVHRDLKPENVFLTRQGRVKILDFGVAKLLPAGLRPEPPLATTGARTEPGVVLGTVGYMSPEQIEGGDVDARCDVFAFGAVLYEMLSGRRAFTGRSSLGALHAVVAGDPPPLSCPEMPPGLEPLVRRCLSKDPAQRFASGRDLALALAAVGGPGGAAGEGRTPGPSQPRRAAQGTAYDLYLDGKAHLLRHTLPEYIAAIDAFERARDADPRFAPALAGIAHAYAWIAFSFQPEGAWYERAVSMLDQALALDPALPEARYVRGRLLWTPRAGFDHAGAMRELCTAIAARPSLDAAYHELGMVLYHVGLLDEALAEQEHPLAAGAAPSLAARLRSTFCRYLMGRWEEALAASEVIARQAPDSWNHYVTALCLIRLDRLEEALTTADRMVREAPGEVLAHPLRGLVLALRGDLAGAREQVRLIHENRKAFGHYHHLQYDAACIHALSGATDEAVTWLSQAARNGFPCQPFFDMDPLLASLRGDPRFERLMAEVRQERARYARLYDELRAA